MSLIVLKDSKILKESEIKVLNTLIGKTSRYKLLYRGTRDGFAFSNLHSKIDDYQNTITVFLSGDNVFGGFTSQTWNFQTGNFKSDDKAFLFSIRQKGIAKSIKYNVKNQSNAVKTFSNSIYGICFGRDSLIMTFSNNQGYLFNYLILK